MTSARRAAGLQIYIPHERRLVRTADLLLAPLGWFARRRAHGPVRRVLLLRLERIGDLLMTIDAIRDARATWPDATIDLAVASWNEPVARMIPDVSRVLVATPPWLGRGEASHTSAALYRSARQWARSRYDVVLNFEPDIRTNALAWLTGGHRRFGYSTGGGGALLTEASQYDPTIHVSMNARQLVQRAAGQVYRSGADRPRGGGLNIPSDARKIADALVANAHGPLIGLHASGGRLSKQWDPDRFGQTASTLAGRYGATIVLTGSVADRPMIDVVKTHLDPATTIDTAGHLDLPALAALLARLDLYVTGDTGPMHLASALDVPVVALFGPSDPRRYGPVGGRQRVLRVDLPCSPCGQVRLPPARCRGHVPDCMAAISVDRVLDAAGELLQESRVGR